MRAILKFEYTDYVVSMEDALRIMDILEKAERYESKYQNLSDGRAHHVWEEVIPEVRSLTLLPDNLYRAAKLLGKPEEK